MQGTSDAFEDPWPGNAKATKSAFIVDVDAFEGPLDILLTLARQQKVDLTQISILELADQYLQFVAEVRDIRLDLAADYLVMAAWLAYLKSRLLLPVDEDEDPSPEQMAEALQFHLRRLEATREGAKKLMQRPQLGADLFRCGNAEGIPVEVDVEWNASFYDLLNAYADHTRRTEHRDWKPRPVEVFTMEQALQRLTELVGDLPDWRDMFALLPPEVKGGIHYRSAVSSTLAASLELTRMGKIELRQTGAFAPIEMRTQREEDDT
ncbi:MAG: segregation/condensation protein A [Rhodospirillaceae bacterium]|nr:segregation/condensation protein A [Rhodospirillaceae bacterium]|tara:strand:+ start:16066 stop:16860 length:795 start_codon:yes stop_codon:yes gene_type:complete